MSFLRHPVQGFPPLPAHAGLVGQKVGEHDAPVPAALLIRDLAVLEQPDQRGPGDAEQLGGLLCGQQRILRDDSDTLAVGHGRCYVNQRIEHRPWYLEALAVGSDQGRLRLRNGHPAPRQLSYEVNDLGQLCSLDEVCRCFPARRPRAHFGSPLLPPVCQSISKRKKRKRLPGEPSACGG